MADESSNRVERLVSDGWQSGDVTIQPIKERLFATFPVLVIPIVPS